MVATRRLGIEGSKNRIRLIEAAEALMKEEGAEAITARRVTAKAQLKTQLLYYYFQNMDDLVLAVAKRNADKRVERFKEAMKADDPLRALFELNADPASAIITPVLMAMSSHRDRIRRETIKVAEQFRLMQIEATARILAKRGISEEKYSAAGVVMLIVAMSRIITTEDALGFTLGHAAGMDLLDHILQELSGNSPSGT